MSEITFKSSSINFQNPETSELIVIRSKAARRLKVLLQEYRESTRKSLELSNLNANCDELHQTIMQCREAERRIAVLLDVYAEEIAEP